MARSLAPAIAVAASIAILAGPASAGETQRLRGVVTVEFPAFDRTDGGCRASRTGSVAKLKAGNRVLVYRGTLEEPTDSSSLEVSDAPIGRGKVGRGKLDRTTDDCDVAFTVRRVPVLPPDEFYVVEVRGIPTTQTVSAERVRDGDLGAIPASI